MNKTQIEIIRLLMDGMPLSLEPYREVAAKVGISEEELLEQLKRWKSDGTIRRIGAILRHRGAGYTANAMVVWNVPDDRAEAFGCLASSVDAVSHCYQRPRIDGFPYNLYTMIHGHSEQECETHAALIAQITGVFDYQLLFTAEEYKKSSPFYFAERD